MKPKILRLAVAFLITTCFATAQVPNESTAPAERQRRRLDPEMIKKYDKNNDGRLDAQETAAARADRLAARKAGVTPSGATKTSIGQLPLTEMGKDDRVAGEEGGLYGGGRNEPPESLQTAAKSELAQIVPRDASGQPSPDGKIVLLSIGMSNTTREFSGFKESIDRDPQKSPAVVVVDGAQGGQAGAEWVDEESRKTWPRADDRLQQAGVTRQQVQAVWLKQAIKSPLADPMANARALRGYLGTIVHLAKVRYPNLRIVYLSSRTFGGYSSKHGEPESFNTALSVRWLIQDQLAGKPELNWDAARGPVQAPLLVWGPYLWADGDHPRRSDELVWRREDFVEDGTHPSPAGQKKVVAQLTRFFKTDPLARSWFVK